MFQPTFHVLFCHSPHFTSLFSSRSIFRGYLSSVGLTSSPCGLCTFRNSSPGKFYYWTGVGAFKTLSDQSFRPATLCSSSIALPILGFRYGGSKLERARDLFEQCLEKVPADEAADFYIRVSTATSPPPAIPIFWVFFPHLLT